MADVTPTWEYYKNQVTDPEQLSARVRMGLRLYVTTAAPTLKEAALAVGLTPAYLTAMANSTAGKTYIRTAHQIIDDKGANTTALIEELSHRAVQKLGQLMEDGKEDTQLRAAIDLADRGSKTRKTHVVATESFALGERDARGLADALIASAQVMTQFAHLRTANFDRVAELEADDVEMITDPSPEGGVVLPTVEARSA